MTVRASDVNRIIKTTSTLRRVWVLAVVAGVYSLLPVYEEYSPYKRYLEFPSSIFTILGLVLSIVLVFRTNRAYDRWWEARILWGKLVNVSRNLAVKTVRVAGADPDDRAQVHRLIAGFAFALKEHLREGTTLSQVPGWDEAEESPRHVPAWLTSQLYARFAEWKDAGRIDSNELLVIDRDAHELLNICGGCERIRNTLIAGSYRSFSLKCLFLYLLALPWGLVNDLKWVAMPLTMIFTYVMVGLETIADNVEEPFGYDLDDLDLERLCLTIDSSTSEVLGVAPLVPPK